jgi:hypothetical protein
MGGTCMGQRYAPVKYYTADETHEIDEEEETFFFFGWGIFITNIYSMRWK